MSEFDLSVAPDANLTSITAPTGFIDLYTTGDSEITFQSTDPSTDIPPYGFGAFSFSSPVAANTQAFLLTDLNDGVTESGTTLGPSDIINATPEPSSIAAFGIAGLLTAGLILRATPICGLQHRLTVQTRKQYEKTDKSPPGTRRRPLSWSGVLKRIRPGSCCRCRRFSD